MIVANMTAAVIVTVAMFVYFRAALRVQKKNDEKNWQVVRWWKGQSRFSPWVRKTRTIEGFGEASVTLGDAVIEGSAVVGRDVGSDVVGSVGLGVGPVVGDFVGDFVVGVAFGCFVGDLVVGVAFGCFVGDLVVGAAFGCFVGDLVVGVAFGCGVVGTAPGLRVVGRRVVASVDGSKVSVGVMVLDGRLVCWLATGEVDGARVCWFNTGEEVGGSEVGMDDGETDGESVVGAADGSLDGRGVVIVVTGVVDGRDVVISASTSGDSGEGSASLSASLFGASVGSRDGRKVMVGVHVLVGVKVPVGAVVTVCSPFTFSLLLLSSLSLLLFTSLVISTFWYCCWSVVCMPSISSWALLFCCFLDSWKSILACNVSTRDRTRWLPKGVLRLLLKLFFARCSSAVLSVVDALSSADEPNSSPGATTAPTHSSVTRHAARTTTVNASFTVHDRGTGDMHRCDVPIIVSTPIFNLSPSFLVGYGKACYSG
jgi:hypothetical protein